MENASKLVFDGGFATQLVAHRFQIDEDPLWSARLLSQNPQAIHNVHEAYLKAGADVILSATYQASIPGFMKHLNCSVSQAEELIQRGAKIVKNACEEYWSENKNNNNNSTRSEPYSCASMGPYGAYLSDGSEYTGSYIETVPAQEVREFHQQRLSLMAQEDLDLYLFETVPALQEAEIIMSLIKEYPNCRFAISFSCKDTSSLNHGESFVDAVRLVNQCEQVVAIGVNCTSPEYITGLLQTAKDATTKKLLVMPNSGEIWEEKEWRSNSLLSNTEVLSGYIEQWAMSGANWIGGCCRTTPTDICNIRKYFEGFAI